MKAQMLACECIRAKADSHLLVHVGVQRPAGDVIYDVCSCCDCLSRHIGIKSVNGQGHTLQRFVFCQCPACGRKWLSITI